MSCKRCCKVHRRQTVIPIGVTFKKNITFRGEDIAPRSTTLEFLIDTPVTLLSVQSHNELYKVEATPAVDGQRYELEVTLLEKPDKDVRGTIRVRTRGAAGEGEGPELPAQPGRGRAHEAETSSRASTMAFGSVTWSASSTARS